MNPGIARAAIVNLIQVVQIKTPIYTPVAFADMPVVQDRLLQGRAGIDAARDYRHAMLTTAEAAVRRELKLRIAQSLPLALAGFDAVAAASQAVDLVSHGAGTSVIRREHRCRYSEDMHATSQHAFLAQRLRIDPVPIGVTAPEPTSSGAAEQRVSDRWTRSSGQGRRSPDRPDGASVRWFPGCAADW